MGMVVESRWIENRDAFIKDGSFVRPQSRYDRALPREVIEDISKGSDRYMLVASKSCPWSHRTLLVRALKKLDDRLALHIAGGPRVEGYALGKTGPIRQYVPPDIRHVHELYSLSDAAYVGPATVPIVWDTETNTIVSNESAQIMRGLDDVDQPGGFTLVPADFADEIETLNVRIHVNLANGVYRAGLARKQAAYDEAVDQIFATLSELEDMLSRRRYLLGGFLTEPDLRLFATLVRFDAVYATHFRCTRHRLVDCADLWAYARDVAMWRGIAGTIDFAAILEGYYANDGVHNPFHIVAERPQADWAAPAHRDHLGGSYIWSRKSGPVVVDPVTMTFE